MKSKSLAIPRESFLPILSLISSFLMFLTFFFYFQSVNGQIQAGVTTPVAAYNNDVVVLFFNFLSSSIPVVLFIVTLCYAKRDLRKLLIPTAMMPIAYVLYEVYSTVHGYAGFIVDQWLRVGFALVICLLCYLTFNRQVIKSKWPLILVCLVGIILSILLCVFKQYPFATTAKNAYFGDVFYEKLTVTYTSALIQFGSYMAAILFLAIPLTPGGEYKVKTSRRFFAMKNMDKIHAINARQKNQK